MLYEVINYVEACVRVEFLCREWINFDDAGLGVVKLKRLMLFNWLSLDIRRAFLMI